MKSGIDKNKLPIALAVIWLIISIPLSWPVYEEVFDEDLLNRLFSWIAVATPSWLSVGWKWLVNGKVFPKWFWGPTVLLNIGIILIFLDDRYLDDHAYIPIGCLLAFVIIIVAYDGMALKTGFKVKKSNPFSDEAMAETRQRLRGVIENNAELATNLADKLMDTTARFIEELNPEMMSVKSFEDLERAGLNSEIPKFGRDKVAAEHSLVCALHVFGKPYDDFSKSGVYDFICSHFITKQSPLRGDPEQFGYVTRKDIPRLIKLVDSFSESKSANVHAAFVFSALMKSNGFPNPMDNEDKMKVGSFGVKSLNTLRNIYKTGH